MVEQQEDDRELRPNWVWRIARFLALMACGYFIGAVVIELAKAPPEQAAAPAELSYGPFSPAAHSFIFDQIANELGRHYSGTAIERPAAGITVGVNYASGPGKVFPTGLVLTETDLAELASAENLRRSYRLIPLPALGWSTTEMTCSAKDFAAYLHGYWRQIGQYPQARHIEGLNFFFPRQFLTGGAAPQIDYYVLCTWDGEMVNEAEMWRRLQSGDSYGQKETAY